MYQKIEEATTSHSDKVEFDLQEFREWTEQSVILLGQVFNNINYNRRLLVLCALMKEHKAKLLLKEKAELLSESYSELFGKNFRDDWCANLKTKQKYQEVLRNESRTVSPRGKAPF